MKGISQCPSSSTKKGGGTVLLEKVSNIIQDISKKLTIVLLLIMFLNVFISALIRYAFDISFVGSYDYSKILFVWCSFLGASIVLKDQAHSKFEFLYGKTKGTTRLILNSFINLCLIVFFTMILIVGTKLSMSVIVQKMPASGISAVWIYLPIVISSFTMLIHSLNFLIKDIFVTTGSRVQGSSIDISDSIRRGESL